MKSTLMRVPKTDAEDIRRIANNLNISISAAFNVWKSKKGMTKEWRDY